MLGEGIGLVGLRRLEDAERDGNPIYAVIKGIGSSSDGRAKSIYAPVSAGQAKALRRAYEASGFGPDTVELVEAHGTGTKAGDAAEFGGLQTVFGETGRKDTQWCALGSIKSQIGHTKASAGAAGLIKATLALHNKVLPPTIKVDTPNPALRIEETPFYLNTEAKPWVRDHAHPRRAGVSSFGFGGSNFHITLEEYTGAGKAALRMRALPAELVAVSAKDPGSLIEALDAVVADLKAGGLAQRRGRGRGSDASRPRPNAVSLSWPPPPRIWKRRSARPGPRSTAPRSPFPAARSMDEVRRLDGSVAFLFPGQGSQSVGMGRDLAMAFERGATRPGTTTRLWSSATSETEVARSIGSSSRLPCSRTRPAPRRPRASPPRSGPSPPSASRASRPFASFDTSAWTATSSAATASAR